MQSAVVLVAVEASSTLPAAEIDTSSLVLPLRRLSIPKRATVLEIRRCNSEGPAHWVGRVGGGQHPDGIPSSTASNLQLTRSRLSAVVLSRSLTLLDRRIGPLRAHPRVELGSGQVRPPNPPCGSRHMCACTVWLEQPRGIGLCRAGEDRLADSVNRVLSGTEGIGMVAW